MANIQDIHAFEEKIYDIVQDYIDDNYDVDDILAISMRCGRINLKADSKDNIKIGKTTEIYSLKDLVRLDDEGQKEPDVDKINEIANSWVFLD